MRDLVKMLAFLLFPLMPAVALAQTAEDAHVQHEGKLADTALNVQYRRTMEKMVAADRSRDDDLKKGAATPDSRPTYAAALLAAERAWLVYRDTHCVTVGLAYRGGAEEDEAEGKCVNDLDRKRTVELKQLSDSMMQ